MKLRLSRLSCGCTCKTIPMLGYYIVEFFIWNILEPRCRPILIFLMLPVQLSIFHTEKVQPCENWSRYTKIDLLVYPKNTLEVDCFFLWELVLLLELHSFSWMISFIVLYKLGMIPYIIIVCIFVQRVDAILHTVYIVSRKLMHIVLI